MRATLEQLGIMKSSSSILHPAGNGSVEQANRTMGNLLQQVVRDGRVTSVYDASRHSTTKHSPYEIVYRLRKP